jgi:hypothetical protein
LPQRWLNRFQLCVQSDVTRPDCGHGGDAETEADLVPPRFRAATSKSLLWLRAQQGELLPGVRFRQLDLVFRFRQLTPGIEAGNPDLRQKAFVGKTLERDSTVLFREFSI